MKFCGWLQLGGKTGVSTICRSCATMFSEDFFLKSLETGLCGKVLRSLNPNFYKSFRTILEDSSFKLIQLHLKGQESLWEVEKMLLIILSHSISNNFFLLIVCLAPSQTNKFQTLPNFFKRIENTVGKEEIARYKHFFLFPHCFQKTCVADTWKKGLILKKVKGRFGEAFDSMYMFSGKWVRVF